MNSGGLISGLLALLLVLVFSVYGAIPLLIFAMALLLVYAVNLSISQIVTEFRNRPPRPAYTYEPEPDLDMEIEKPAVPLTERPRSGRKKAIDIPLDEEDLEVPEYKENKVGFFNKTPRVKTPDQLFTKGEEESAVPVVPMEPVPDPEPEAETEQEQDDKLLTPSEEHVFAPDSIKKQDNLFTPVAEEISDPPKVVPVRKTTPGEVRAEAESIAESIEKKQNENVKAYVYPPVEFLKKGSGSAVDGTEEITLNRDRLETTIRSFGVAATIVDITRGPTVTRYDLELEAGVKLNKLTNLAGDLALSLGVGSVRIAPIPDKISTVGIEVPNKLVSTVYLRDIIESPAFKNATSKLSFAIGKDIGGNCIVGNIAKLPHMLIAGTTGSGKSVCMNSLILSLLYKSTPEEVRFIMVDPKMVELGIYNGIPHLYIPVVTDPKKAAGALQWSVVEMLKRYRLFSEVGVRDLAGYNAHQRRIGEQTLPQVVIVIDELADLMLVASKEVEESICRVAQMGRASGMHLVIATQRPSADVITGLMKANIPSRIAFAVSSAMESRIILDCQGAEKLIGQGDMLYAPLGSGKPLRVQGAFVSDEEREEIVQFVKSQSEAEYSEEILAHIEKSVEEKDSSGAASGNRNEAGEGDPFSEYDTLLPQAVDVIFETKQASVSMLQRRLKLGYSRAARLVDQLEEIGVVGPFEGSKPRQILITREQWQEMQMIHGTAPIEQPEQMQAPVEMPEFTDDDPENWDDEV